MLEALGNLGEFIGGLAVIATLLYLAMQVRQNTQLLRANALAVSAAANLSFNQLLGSDPAAARVFQVGLENFASLPDEEKRQFINLLRTTFLANEHVFRQYEQGLIDEQVWLQDRRSALRVLALPHVVVWWHHRKHVFLPSFAAAIDDAVANSPESLEALAGEVIAEMVARAPGTPT